MQSSRNLWNWWIGELRDLLPAFGGGGRGSSERIVLVLDEGRVRALAQGHGRSAKTTELFAGQAMAPVEMTRVLASSPLGARGVPICIAIAIGDCHVRHVDLPAAARRDFDRLLALDIERSTPMRVGDVMWTHTIEDAGAGPGLSRVRQILVKKRTVEPLLSALAEAGLSPASIEVWDPAGQGAQPIAFAAGDKAAPVRMERAARMLAAAALLLAVAAPATYWLRHELALHEVSRRHADLAGVLEEARALSGRAGETAGEFDRIRQVAERRPPAAAILEEVTRLLPDTAWIEELRLEGESVEIAGTAASAARLLSAFQASSLLRNAQFTAPVRFEGGSGERFRLRAEVVGAPPAARAAVREKSL